MILKTSFVFKISLVRVDFQANLSPKVLQHISINDWCYPIILYPALNLGIDQVDYTMSF